MARRRFAPLIAVVLVGTAVLVARLFQVQIVERSIWADQAATLVRAGSVRPYRRGSILDRKGRELAHDETTYRVQMNYRDFRRAHPVGLVAHARSALLGRPIALAEALEHLPEWADELVTLTPAQFDAFARGDALEHATLVVAASDDPELDDRRGRRSDARFYATQLFGLERAQTLPLVRAMRERTDETLVELVADITARGDVALVHERLRARLLACSEDLERLALQLDADESERGAKAAEGAALDRLVVQLEAWRAGVEDDAASELFREAAGFSAGRIDDQLVARTFDLRWLAALMRWDDTRIGQWLARARAGWLDSVRSGRVERWMVELELGERDGPLVQRVLARWEEPFAMRVESDEVSRLAVFDQLDDLFARGSDDEDDSAVLPFQHVDALGAGCDGADDWRWLARAEIGLDAPAASVDELALAWQRAFDDGFDADFVRERTLATLASWEAAFQSELETRIGRRLSNAREESGDATLALPFSASRLDRARERARYVLKDRGSRALEIARRPSYATVHLLTRHPERFAGVRVVEAHDRVQARDGEGRVLGGALLGNVAIPTWRDQVLERDLRAEFDALRRKGTRTDEEQRDLEWLAPRVARSDEQRGVGGIEGYCDRELAGRNGYREQRGLQELIEGRAELELEPQDGLDVVLTLDADLQRAARECLADPEPDPNPTTRDYAWLANPTGAIVLLTPRGDVLAAASFPDAPRGEAEHRASRDQPFERTLRKPTFQPPGSVFKPFVATWALDHVTFDPLRQEPCVYQDALDYAGYVDVRCNVEHGHGLVDLREALKRSCNSYFARLGEHFEQDDWRELAREFGFGEPTGVRAFGSRRGLAEDTLPSLFERELKGRDFRLAGNGLALVEATPMQIARGYAALATGELSDVRLIDRVGENEVPRRSRKLSVSAQSLAFVRKAMEACANEAGGSAQPALDESEIGVRMAAKTGSGDIGERMEKTADGKTRVRKHTWLAGWLPADDPKLVIIVFVHDTLQTASHSSIWIARQLLLRPEVQSYLHEEHAK